MTRQYPPPVLDTASTQLPAWRQLFVVLLTLATLAACKHRNQTTDATGAGQSSSPPSFVGQLIQGADQPAIRTYLKSVRELTPKKFAVTWSTDTVPVSRDEVARSLLKVGRDGSTFVFSSSQPIVKKLAAGKIVWIWGVAIRRITRVVRDGETTVVSTTAVPLSEAMPQSDIEFDSPIHFGDAYAIMKPTSAPAKPGPARTTIMPPASRFATHARRSSLMPVRYDNPPEGTDSSSEGPSLESTEEEDAVAATRDGYTGKIAGFEFSLAYNVSGEKLAFELQARKEDEESPGSGESKEMLRDERHEFFEAVHEQRQAEHEAEEAYEQHNKMVAELSEIAALSTPATLPPTPSKLSQLSQEALQHLKNLDEIEAKRAMKKYEEAEAKAKAAREKAKNLAMAGAIAKQVFYIVSDNLDIRFRTRVELSKAALIAAVKTSNGSNAGTSINFKDVKGKVDVEVVARMGLSGNGGVSIPVTHIPLVFNIPLVINGVPFIVQIGTDFLVKIALAGRHAAHHFHARFDFNGNAGYTASAKSQSDTNFNLSGAEPEIEATEASSPGVSGTVVAVQIPRLGAGVGVFGAAALGYLDQVVVLTMTNGAGVATLNPSCKRYTLDRIAHVGADVTTVLPIPVVQQMLQLLSWKKEVWRAKQWLRVEPDIPMCRI